jgi:hypothetical protein
MNKLDIIRLLADSTPVQKAELLRLLQPNLEDENPYTELDVQYLKTVRDRFLLPSSFTEGQVVKWKKGLKNRRLPKEKQPAIVMEVPSQPLIDHQRDVGSPYFHETLDIVLGVIDEEGDFVTFFYDKRRFELF